MGKIQTVGKGGAWRMGKIKIIFFAGTYTRTASEEGHAWRVTWLRKKKRNLGKMHGRKLREIEYFWESPWEKMEKIEYSWEKFDRVWENLSRVSSIFTCCI